MLNLEKTIISLARDFVKKYHPVIIGITGNVGKTLTETALQDVLSVLNIRTRALKGESTKLKMALTILGGDSETAGFFPSLLFVIRSFWYVMVMGDKKPPVIILEYPLTRPGEMSERLSVARPNVGIITGLGDIPSNIEQFENMTAVIKELHGFVAKLGSHDYLILNSDDKNVLPLINQSRAQAMTFGFDEGAGLKIINFENRYDFDKLVGISFKLETAGNFVPVRIDGVVGRFHAYAAAAAGAYTLLRGINLVKTSEALAKYSGLPGRSRLLAGIKNTYLIDDTYDSSIWGMVTALETFHAIEAKRKIAVLGDVLNLGKYAETAHEELGRLVKGSANILITVGPRSRFIAEGARDAGFSKKDILSFDDADEAGIKLQEIMKEGDVVLIKGSKALTMERIVLEVMAEPQKAEKLLVRPISD